jgi:hypothetical protein
MSILARHICILLLALPAAVLAEPVAVTTRSTGTSNVDNTILGALGLDSVAGTPQLPYELLLGSTFEPAAGPPGGSSHANDYGGEVVVDFRIGSQVYHYNGAANSSVFRYDQSPNVDSYEHHIWFDTPGPPNANYTVHFYNRFNGLPGGMGLAPLVPLHIDGPADQNGGVWGYYSINAYPSNPDVPLAWNMGGPNATVYVDVAAVPEPAPFVLLAAGLLTLGLRRRFK